MNIEAMQRFAEASDDALVGSAWIIWLKHKHPDAYTKLCAEVKKMQIYQALLHGHQAALDIPGAMELVGKFNGE